MTLARMIRLNKVSSTPQLALREMEANDVAEVTELFSKYMARFGMAPVMKKEEVEHMLLSGRGRGDVDSVLGRREGQVVWSYVVEVWLFASVLRQKLTAPIGTIYT
jgi:glycylpeptide N-tetradecanoyltransferase